MAVKEDSQEHAERERHHDFNTSLNQAGQLCHAAGKQAVKLVPRLASGHSPGAATARTSPMKARVYVTLKNGVLDPQGKAIHHALEGLGFDGVRDVRAGKLIELDLSEDVADADIEAMCKRLLANTVIENYRIERA
jgi:phosphoribosylformylglycinamidine synthase